MNESDVFELLAANKNDRGIDNWRKLTDTQGLESFGIGLTVLRKLAKKIGRNHELALVLWDSRNYDAKVISLLIDDPKKISRAQVEQQVEGLGIGLLTHVFSSCDATLAKAPFAFELARTWMKSDDAIRRQCGFGLVYEFSKNKRNKNFTDEFFFDCLSLIDEQIAHESSSVRMSMGSALMGIGKRNLALNTAAIKIAKVAGSISFGDGHCEPFNVLKHIDNETLLKKLHMQK